MDLFQLCMLLLGLALVVLFWRFRASAERAVTFSQAYCEKNALQYISLARIATKFTAYKGKLDWQLHYELAFTSDGETEYKGFVVCHGKHIVSIDLPAYKIPG